MILHLLAASVSSAHNLIYFVLIDRSVKTISNILRFFFLKKSFHTGFIHV